MMTQLHSNDVKASTDLRFRATPQRMSETVKWLLRHDHLESLLQSNDHVFPAFMRQLDQTLEEAFREQDSQSLFETQKSLYHLYEDSIGTPRPGWGQNQYHPFVLRIRNEIERAWDTYETGRVNGALKEIPSSEPAFIEFMRELCASRGLAKHPLFAFLESQASYEQMVEFFLHEGLLILRFCDLMVLSLLGVDEDVREELAANFWDEVGNGNYRNRHTELFKRLLRHVGVKLSEIGSLSEDLGEKLDWQGLAGYNLYVYFGLHRRNFFKFVGGMGVAEYMDPPQYAKILAGCRRVGLTDKHALAYYASHAELDVEHGEAWFTNVISPLIRKHPDAKHDVALGAIMRINTTSDYYDYLHRKLTTSRTGSVISRDGDVLTFPEFG